ncbi:MAG: alkaline phosphatase family protein [Bacteroidales bacterium]|nr:alkaline phosphatase family protein [Bacteroidales bacterium]
MKYIFSFIIIFIIIFTPKIQAQKRKLIPPEKPKLIIGIVIDQMRYDIIYRYWDKFDDNGFKRLINQGTFCRNTNYNYLFTESGVGYATISTGTNPSYHGIVSNRWYLRLKEKIIYCVEDDKTETIGAFNNNGKMSPKSLLTSNIGDELMLFNNHKSKVIGISLNDYAAILSAGHTANAAYWFDSESGNWISSSFYLDSLPDWVEEFNNKEYYKLYLNREWKTLLPIEKYIFGNNDDNPYEEGIYKQHIFPYDLVKLNKNKKGYDILKYTPFGNTFTKDFVISTIVNEQLGKDEFTDLLIIGFSSTGYINKQFGPRSVELEDAILRLDKELSHFLDFIDEELSKENVLLFLTSDQGSVNVPRYLSDSKIPSGYFNYKKANVLLKSYLNSIYGQGDWVVAYNKQQIYLNQLLIEDSKLKLKDVQNITAQFLLQFTGVANVITATTLQNTNFSDGIFNKMQNSYNQKRSGDVIINLEPGWTEQISVISSENSPYSYDTHVPLIWYGWKIKRQILNTNISIIDITPTISNFLNISFPNGCIGKPINGLID